jgi:hypothetical protein
VKKTAQATRKTFSTTREVPFTTRNQTAAAPRGMERYLLTPKISHADAQPANSATVFPRLAMIMATRRKKVGRTPNFSRMRSASVFPVTTPIRATISWTTIRAIMMGIRVQSSVYPKWAPALEYVATPPASLSTDAVMIPGPRTARKSRSLFLLNRKNGTAFPSGRIPFPRWKIPHLRRGPLPEKGKIPVAAPRGMK